MTGLYDRLSGSYDWLSAAERPLRRRALFLLALQPGDTFLDIGCATGQVLPAAARTVGPSGRVIGLDIAAGMLRQAQHKALVPNTTLLRADGRFLPLHQACCDAILISFTLELFDPEGQHKLLGQCRHALRAYGRLVLLTLSTHEKTVVSEVYWRLNRAFPQIIDCRPIAAAQLVRESGLQVRVEQRDSLYGLPVSLLLAAKR